MIRHIAATTLMAVMVQGCSFLEFMEDGSDESAHVEDPAAILLAQAALEAQAALATLAQARAAENPAEAQPPPRLVPEELLAEVTLDWIGPLETLAASLASRAGFAFLEAGQRPPTPLLVDIHADAAPLILVLRDAGIQAAEAAMLTIDAAARQVRLDWSTDEGAAI